jgi:NADH-quinone oxidoreductase subunit I
VEVCPFDAIKMDTAFELGGEDRFEGLLMNKQALAKPNVYYQGIHPSEAAEVDARLQAAVEKARAAAEAKSKSTPGPAT